MRRAPARNTIVVEPSPNALTLSELDDLVEHLDEAVPGLKIRAKRVQYKLLPARGLLDHLTILLPDLPDGLLVLLGRELLSVAVQWAKARWTSKPADRPITVVVKWPDGTWQKQLVGPRRKRPAKRRSAAPRGRKR